MKLTLPLLVFLPAVAFAQERAPIATDRPGFSDGSNVVGRNVSQIEAGFFRTFQGGDAFTTAPDLLVRHGVTDDFEIRLVGLTYGFTPGANDWLDPSVGFKYRLQRPAGKRGEITFEGQTTVPVGTSPLRADQYNPTFKLLFSTPVGNDSLGGNVVWSQIGSGAGQFNQSALSLYYCRSYTPKFALTLEAWGVDHIAPGDSSGTYGSLAGTYLVNNDTQLDLRVGSGFNEARDGWFIQGGISIRF